MKTRMTLLLVLAASLSLPAAAAEAKKTIPGQQSMVIIEGNFQFIPGSWADYTILDKAKNETYRMLMSVLDQENYKGLPCRWLEIEVAMKDQPTVVTRILAAETKNGPGDLQKAVIQVEGYSPFNVPRKFLQGKDQEVAKVEPARVVKRLERKTLSHLGKTIQAWVVEAQTAQGQNVSAVVSEELPPFCLYQAETEDTRLTVNDWGLGAKTRIIGEPTSFFLWILEQIGRELGKK
ncbi:MAG TPA: hypothetical protein VGB72_01715 [Acidobacteriota bacterium]